MGEQWRSSFAEFDDQPAAAGRPPGGEGPRAWRDGPDDPPRPAGPCRETVEDDHHPRPGRRRADQVRRDFTANAAAVNSRWCGDITYIGTLGRVAVPDTVIDVASRRVVGYAMAGHLRTELVADALANAVAARDPQPAVIFHSDRGCQYTSAAFAALAGDCQVGLSHGRTGLPLDRPIAGKLQVSDTPCGAGMLAWRARWRYTCPP